MSKHGKFQNNFEGFLKVFESTAVILYHKNVIRN